LVYSNKKAPDNGRDYFPAENINNTPRQIKLPTLFFISFGKYSHFIQQQKVKVVLGSRKKLRFV
jgi:hypothetical protein